MEIQGLIILTLLFSAAIIGMSVFVGDMMTYHSISDYPELAYINKTKEMSEKIADMKDPLEERKLTGVAVVDIPVAISTGVIESMRTMLSALDVLTSFIYDIQREVGIIPTYVTAVAIAIVSVIITFGVINAITKVRV